MNFIGFGLSLKGKNILFFGTFGHLLKKNDSLFLEVSEFHEILMLFQFTGKKLTSFVCKYLRNEFQKRRKYDVDSLY